MDELNKKFKDWSIKNDVRMHRFMSIMERFAKNTGQWVDTLYSQPPDVDAAVAKRNKLHALHRELGYLLEEAHEMYDDMATDHEDLIEVFELLGKEIEKLPDDTP